MKTTLNKIREHDPCKESWEKLLNSLNKTKADDEPIELKYILDLLGIEDAIWALGSIDADKEIRLFACDCAESVLHIFEEKYQKDKRPRKAIETSRSYAIGKATREELDAAGSAAWDARSAAGSAAWDAGSAAWDAGSAAGSAAMSAAGSAARFAAWDAGSAAGSAAWDAGSAAGSAARSAARSAEEEKQKELFIKYFCK